MYGLVGVHAEDDDRRRPRQLLRPRRHLDAVHLRHRDVDDQHVGLVLLAQAQRLEAVRRFRHHGDAGLGFEQAAQAAPDDAVIVSQQHAQARPRVRPATAAGECVTRRAGAGFAANLRPCRAARARALRCRAGRAHRPAAPRRCPTPSSRTDDDQLARPRGDRDVDAAGAARGGRSWSAPPARRDRRRSGAARAGGRSRRRCAASIGTP